MDDRDVFQLHQPQPLLLVISGPSGVGKDSVIRLLKERQVVDLSFVITMTDRAPREDEVPGRDYYFVSTEEFKQKIRDGELLEYAVVYNQFKGVPKSEVRRAFASGKDVVMRVDVQGAATLRRLYPEALMVMLVPKDEAELRERLRGRGTETEEEVEQRLQKAIQELKQVDLFDYVVVNPNGGLFQAVEVIESILRAEHHRYPHRKVIV